MKLERVDFFMRKLLLFIFTVIVALLVYINVNASELIIPSEVIRVRVVANSNTLEDQTMKMKVKKYIEDYLAIKLVNVDDLDKARNIINNELDNLNKDIKELFQENDYDEEIIIHFGDNFFPEKEYKGTIYEQGIYESLVITIGEGQGDNWWCVLFPPLCLLEATENEIEEVKYQFFVKKMLDKIFE